MAVETYGLRYAGHLLAGVDEVGRGPLAGEVVCAAVILDPQKPVEGLADSKKLTHRQRENLYQKIISRALAWSLGRADVEEIDRYNILEATMLAMRRAIAVLSIEPEYLAVDGNRMPTREYPGETVVGGDSRIPAISAASIVAKVTRDREMVAMNVKYPGYGFDQHKGYGTKQHLDALRQLGPCPIHRRSFEPIKSMIHCP